MTPADIVPWLTALAAVLGLVLSVARGRRGDVESNQAIRDKLDYISDTTRDTRDDVREIKRTLDDHSARLARLEERTDDHARRLANLEN